MRRYEDTYSAKKTEKKTELEDDDVFSPQSDDETGNWAFNAKAKGGLSTRKKKYFSLNRLLVPEEIDEN